MHEMTIERIASCDGCSTENHRLLIEHQGDTVKLSIERRSHGHGGAGYDAWRYELSRAQIQEIIDALSNHDAS